MTGQYVDLYGAHEYLNELGFRWTIRKVRRLADERKLPFFLGPDRKRWIAKDTIREVMESLQSDAIKKTEEAA